MSQDSYVEEITPQGEDFSRWYLDVVQKAQLADYAPVRGCVAVRPYGFAIWEAMQSNLDERFKATGVENAYFPLLIPESIFKKEAEHIEGFAPEAPWVTHAGEEELSEKLVIRPSSETIIGTMFSRWIQSYRDLPMVLNQWCSVVRWEKATYPFIRTSEFLWQEGHTCHRDENDARKRARMMVGVYRDFLQEELAVPVIDGIKSEREKFAGAVDTFTVEALMGDGRGLQAGTSHYLGDGFARVMDIKFLDEDGEHKLVHQTSWGVSHRLIGAVIMVHGDDRGLRLPPKIAPKQAVIVPIYRQDSRSEVLQQANRLQQELAEARISVHLDDREGYTPGWKFNDWEMRGVPIRLELGPRDMEDEQVVLVRRDTGDKESVSWSGLAQKTTDVLDDISENMFKQALDFREKNTRAVDEMSQLKEIISGPRGYVLAGWCGDAGCEAQVKEKTGATIQCIPFDEAKYSEQACLCCGSESGRTVVFARPY